MTVKRKNLGKMNLMSKFSCDYNSKEDFLIDDDYIDQPELTLQESPMVENRLIEDSLAAMDSNRLMDSHFSGLPRGGDFDMKRALFFQSLWEEPEHVDMDIR